MAEGDVDHYSLDVPKLYDCDVTVQIISSSGNADLYIKPCFAANQGRECLFTEEEISTPERFDNIQFSKNRASLDSVTYRHNSALCEESEHPCRYVIAAAGKCCELAVFTISGSYNKEAELVLIESYPVSRLVYYG